MLYAVYSALVCVFTLPEDSFDAGALLLRLSFRCSGLEALLFYLRVHSQAVLLGSDYSCFPAQTINAAPRP